MILVGHSYGGTVIRVAGADPNVKALVYVAALQPDVGETANQLPASMPGTAPTSDVQVTKGGFLFVDPTKFASDVAADLPPAQAKYMADSQPKTDTFTYTFSQLFLPKLFVIRAKLADAWDLKS